MFKLLDIQINNNKIYAVKDLFLTSKAIENDLLNYTYSGCGLIKDQIVENARLPYFAETFYQLIFMQNKLPTEDEFIQYYINYNNMFLGNLNIDGVKARLLRTYPSLIRDFHFYLLLNESNLFDSVKYSYKKDTEEGIDLYVSYQKQWYGLSLMIDSARGNGFKNQKYNRHNYNNIKEIIIKLNKNQCNIVGKFYLYNNLHIEEILNKIKNISNNEKTSIEIVDKNFIN